jgi:DNA repair protein RecN (Recombination protein N)
MLRELSIRNFAIVEKARIPFGRGLNVITGETGAGKSLIINALELVLGGKVKAEFIHPMAEEAEIEAVFELPERLILPESISTDDELLIIRRIFSKNTKGRAYINDRAVSLKILSAVGEQLIDIHGQHEHQSLLKPSVQQYLLDSFGGLTELAQEVRGLYLKLRSLKKTLTELRERARERSQRIDLLQYQIEEIEQANLSAEELDELFKEREVQRNLTHLVQLTESSLNRLKEQEDSVLDTLSVIKQSIEDILKIDNAASSVLKMIQDAEALLYEAAHEIRGLRDTYEADPNRLDEIERRLEQIERLKRKYGDTVEEILQYRDTARKELDELLGMEETETHLSKDIEETEKQLMDRAKLLSEKRKIAAKEIERLVTETLKDLAMKNARFSVSLKDTGITEHGLEGVEFVFSANPGQPVKPLNRVASGGELSRVMLAIKGIFASSEGVPVLVFDEIDAGIGGKTAEALGTKLLDISRLHQVICITHLAQIASLAEHHLRVTKNEKKQSTHFSIDVLSEEERTMEIARMLSGSVTETSLKHAEELLQKRQKC